MIASAAIVALNGMWAVEGMDAFSRDWSVRLRESHQVLAAPSGNTAPAASPTESEIFDSLNGHIGHRLSRLIVWSLGVQGLAGITLLFTSYRMRTTGARPDADEAA